MKIPYANRLLIIAVAVMSTGNSAQAAGPYYWDNNGTTTGFGTATGTWGTDAFWNSLATGGAGSFTATTATTDAVNFGTATDGLGAGTIAVGTVDSGNITFGAASGAIALTGGTITLAATAAITTSNASDSISSVLAGAATSLTKAGTGILTLTGANTYTGTTTISAGTLALSGGNNRLATTGSVNFSSTSTLDLGSTSQTLANLTVANNITGTVTGSSGTLTLGANAFSLGSTTASTTQTLNLSGLGTFNYNSAGNAFTVSGQNSSTNGLGSAATMTLATDNTITASSITVGRGFSNLATGYKNTGTLNLGHSNVLNTGTINIGVPSKGFGTVKFNTGLAANPSLTIRGVTGGTSRADMNVGANSSGTTNFTSLVDLTTGYTGGTTLDARIGTLLMANANRGGGSANSVSGSFNMAGGTLDATTIILTQSVSGNLGDSTATGAFTLGITGGAAGGTVKVETLKFVERPGLGTMNATFNLNNGGTLAAKSITGDAGVGTRTFTWNDGTIKNYDTSNDLTISAGLTTFNLAGAGLHAFDISTGRTGTVNQIMSGTGSLTKLGDGTLVLAGANTNTGVTKISAGTLSVGTIGLGNVAGNLGKATNAATNLVFDGGTLQYTGSTDTTDRNFTINTGKTATFDVTNAANTLTVSGASTATTGALTKTGAGTLKLTGANLHSGTTTVDQGTLALGIGGSIANSSDIALTTSGAVLDVSAVTFTLGSAQTLKGVGSVTGTVITGASSSTIAPGLSPGTLTLGALDASAGGNFDFELGISSDELVITGALTGSINAGDMNFNFSDAGGIAINTAYTLFTFGSQTGLHYSDLDAVTLPSGLTLDTAFGTGGWQINSGSLQVQFVPEPAAALLGGLGTLLLLRRRKV